MPLQFPWVPPWGRAPVRKERPRLLTGQGLLLEMFPEPHVGLWCAGCGRALRQESSAAEPRRRSEEAGC